MRVFASNLRARASELGLTQNEVAARADLSERHTGNYFADARQPDLTTLVRLAAVLGVTPNDLLLPRTEGKDTRLLLKGRLDGAAAAATDRELAIMVQQAEALVLGRD